VKFDDRDLFRNQRHDDRFVGGDGDSDSDNGRFGSVARLAKAKSFVELRSRPEP
jgi:hypothetical protein